ncbi:MAG: DUF1326 domain-containing protein [Chloroflexota bacterium]
MANNGLQWNLKGTVLLACNCDYGCPCNFNALPTNGDCEGGWTWQIEEGEFEGTPLDGLTFSLYADWPQAIHQGNGEAVILIDESADEAQRDAITALTSGQAGGPWAILANTFSKVHGPKFIQHEVDVDANRSSVRIGDAVRLEMEPIRNPVTGAEVNPKVILPEGFVWKDGTLASSAAFEINEGISFAHPGKYAALSPFEYHVP